MFKINCTSIVSSIVINQNQLFSNSVGFQSISMFTLYHWTPLNHFDIIDLIEIQSLAIKLPRNQKSIQTCCLLSRFHLTSIIIMWCDGLDWMIFSQSSGTRRHYYCKWQVFGHVGVVSRVGHPVWVGVGGGCTPSCEWFIGTENWFAWTTWLQTGR